MIQITEQEEFWPDELVPFHADGCQPKFENRKSAKSQIASRFSVLGNSHKIYLMFLVFMICLMLRPIVMNAFVQIQGLCFVSV